MYPINEIKFDSKGLIRVILQSQHDKSIVMTIWMNKYAIEQTINTNKVTYLCKETKLLKTNDTLHVLSIIADCDKDCILIIVKDNNYYTSKSYADKKPYFNTRLSMP